jgi:spore germination protein YaaH
VLGVTCVLATAAIPAKTNPVRHIAAYGYYSDDNPDSWATIQAQGHRLAGVITTRDERVQVPFFVTPRTTVYFESRRSVELRMIMATRFGVAGMAFWRLGYESPDVWDSLGVFLKSSVRSAAR